MPKEGGTMLHDILSALIAFFSHKAISDYLFPMVSSIYITFVTIRLTQFFDVRNECIDALNRLTFLHLEPQFRDGEDLQRETVARIQDVRKLTLKFGRGGHGVAIQRLNTLCDLIVDNYLESVDDSRNAYLNKMREEKGEAEFSDLDMDNLHRGLFRVIKDTNQKFFLANYDIAEAHLINLTPNFWDALLVNRITNLRPFRYVSDRLSYLRELTNGDDPIAWPDYRAALRKKRRRVY